MSERSIPKATGSLEGFYRYRSTSAPSSANVPPTVATQRALTTNTTSPEVKQDEDMEFSAHGLQTPPAKSPPAMRRSSSTRKVEGRPALNRQRSKVVLKSTFSAAATEAAVEDAEDMPLVATSPTSMVCSVPYRGMEVLFCTSSKGSLLCVCPRTRVVLQLLPLSGKVISLTANAVTGMVAVALSNGTVETFLPIPTTCKPTDSDDTVSAFCKFRWIKAREVQCRNVFYGQGGEPQQHVFRHKLTSDPGSTVDISSSSDYKVLVAHLDQLAVFDATPEEAASEEAELLWTVRLERNVVTAKLSGDGHAMALVLEREGLEKDNPYGVRTFVRDAEDGSSFRSAILEPKIDRPSQVARTSSAKSIGILYKPGPFLEHTASVSSISFRGFGHVTSNVYSEEVEGNDLLMTHCENGNTVRIFSQNSWKQLMEWTTPPHTRADWIHGLSAFNLGDLESSKRRKTSGSNDPSRRPSFSGDDAAAINADLLGNARPTTGPNTAAGAWILEVTFRRTFPALRLSRLSYMKRGGDEMQPAHFESVAAILPSSSLAAESVLGMGDVGLSVQGIWPAWNPWWSEPLSEDVTGTLRGSAMNFLGLSSVASSGFFGETNQAGTHGPPSELRLVASHPVTGKIVLMEFPMWGDEDFGAMELGSPLRYLLSLDEVDGMERVTAIEGEDRAKPILQVPPPVAVHHESSILCSHIEEGGKSVAVTWRKPGSMAVLPGTQDAEGVHATVSISSSDSSKSLESLPHPDDSDEVDVFKDVSVIPVPLSLPTLALPHVADDEVFVALQWWSDEINGGPARLLGITSSGSLMLYEMPPLWSAIEPPMPSHDPFMLSDVHSMEGIGSEIDSIEDDESEYEVMITPHPDFGIGLRLEAQAEGMPAVAGSFKKHPLNGGSLPAEKTGMISLGDELVSVNGIRLEGISFDEIIATVRGAGGDAPKAKAICMKFRPVLTNRKRFSSAFSLTGSLRSEGSSRRTMEEILGVKLKEQMPKDASKDDSSAKPSSSVRRVTGQTDAEDSNSVVDESQDSFSWRLIAFVKGALPVAENTDDYQSRLVLLPWKWERRCFSTNNSGVALLLVADGKCLHAKRLEIAADGNPSNARCHDLGMLDVGGASSDESNVRTEGDRIENVEVVPSGTESWCVAVQHVHGTVRLVFIEVDEVSVATRKPDDTEIGSPVSSTFTASFRHFPVFQTEGSGLVRASSVELLATLCPFGEHPGVVTVWSARPAATIMGEGTEMSVGHRPSEYVSSTLSFEGILNEKNVRDDEILDIRFIPPGSFDGFPWIVTMTENHAIVHRRDGGSYEWKSIILLSYATLCNSVSHQMPRAQPVKGRHFKGRSSPADTFPHLIPTLRCLSTACDEKHFLRSDWHPDTILAYACSEAQGIKTSLRRNVKGVYQWLSLWLDPDENKRPTVDTQYPLAVAPLRAIEGHVLLAPDDETSETEDVQESAASFMSPLGGRSAPMNEGEASLKELQQVLCPGQRMRPAENNEIEEDGPNNTILPQPLENLNSDEIRLLWAVGELILDPPQFKQLDSCSQLALFSVSLRRHLERAKNPDEEEETRKAKSSEAPSLTAPARRRSFLVKKSATSAKVSEKEEFVPIASAGCLAAIASSTQGSLMEKCRVANEKFDWETARSLRLPFWIRSDDKLRTLCQEIGQTVYKKTRNVMECALFFVIIRNMRTLRNLAMTDQSISGRTFLKFITDQDFSSQRGRKAAEKNAYSLLRKRRYQVAASFFLLAEPPMLKSALEIIVTQMEDLDLAFLVSRMVESSQNTGSQSGGFGGALGNTGMGAGGMMGLGVGYASGGGQFSSAGPDEVTFDDWRPKLGKVSRNLLEDRGIATASHDPCLQALQIIWLGRREEASRSLSGLSHHCSFKSDGLQNDAIFPRMFDLRLAGTDSGTTSPNGADRSRGFTLPKNSKTFSANLRVLKKANSVINFVSCPFLVTSLNASTRSRWASTLLVSRALKRRGIELAATRLLLQQTDELDLDQREAGSTPAARSRNQAGTQQAGGKAQKKALSSSVFDSFDTAPAKKPKAAATAVPSSSIFDSFDAPPQKQPPTTQESMSSSIFDGFDAPPAKKPTAAGPSSSIFDAFDAPPQKPKPQPSTTQDPMSSSIFDGFDAAPAKKPSQPQPTAAGPSSSIFDAFDAPPSKPKLEPPATQDPMSSSIFDGYDAPPTKKPPTQQAQMASSIFDAFDGPPQKAKNPNSSGSNGMVAPTSYGPVPSQDEFDEGPPDMLPIPTPKLWVEWRRRILIQTVARRLLREMASFVSCFHGDTVDAPITLFRRRVHPLVPSSAGEILNQNYDGVALVARIKCCLEDLCSHGDIGERLVVDEALRIVSCPLYPNRVVYAILLYAVTDRSYQAEEKIRDAAVAQIQRCEAVACSNDQLVENRRTSHYMASQYLRRLSARVSWQLELCLWLNRGGTLPLSGHIIKQAVVAVRIGLVIASWGRCHEYLETMMRCEPDLQMDDESGRQLWSSMKLIVDLEDRTKAKTVGTGSGGWEFLVDCRREEATEMLRERLPGTFIIRPHAADSGVFTLSFKTNLIPTEDVENDGNADETKEDNPDEEAAPENPSQNAPNTKPVKKDDVVQHAIVRLSDAGFRCGSFGPFATLMQLLEAVSRSLPFDLLFDKPPVEGIIKDEGTQPSPNAVFLRKLALTSHSDSYRWNGETTDSANDEGGLGSGRSGSSSPEDDEKETDPVDQSDEKAKAEFSRRKVFGMFLQLLVLSEIRKQLSAVATAECDEPLLSEYPRDSALTSANIPQGGEADVDSVGSVTEGTEHLGVEESYAVASRIVRPLLTWVRLLETGILSDIAPSIKEASQATAAMPVEMAASETAIELAPPDVGSCIDGGDAVIRRMIQPDSGVEFRTLRVGEGFESAMIILFSKTEAQNWLISNGAEKNEEEALARLARMEKRRVIEPIEMKDLTVKAFTSADKKDVQDEVRYRFVDPWEVEVLESREAETMAASLGREHFYAFSVNNVARSCEGIIRSMGGLHLLSLWTHAKGGLRLTKAIASVHAPWERDAGGDLQMTDGVVAEPSAYSNSIRKHLYRNALFRRLKVPQRFLALVQVELLDLKNLTSPSGSPSLTVFALLRLKRPGSNARLTNKARTLDSAATQATKVGKSTGPNAPASWGSVVRFRFPLPEDVNCDGVSSDGDREALFKGPPSVLQIAVYEKKFMSDISLGGADIDMDALTSGGQLEEWVPLRASKHGINWFARIRLTLRFELMCLGSDHPLDGELPPSVGLRKIQQLSRQGGAHEDTKVKKSASTPDLFGYFESMVS